MTFMTRRPLRLPPTRPERGWASGSKILCLIGLLAPASTGGSHLPAHSYEARPGQPSLGPRQGEAQDEFRWRGKVAPGSAIEIKGVNGDVRALPASSAEVEVVATKRGRRSDPDQVEIEVLEHAGGVTICAVYPTPRSKPANECRPGEGGRMSIDENDVHVDFTVRVPARVRFIGRTVNGGVEAESLASFVEAETVNGSIRIMTAGYAQAATVNGSIAASLGRADWRGPVEFRTVNGRIDLDLPATTSATVEAETVNGEISSEFPLTVQGRFGPKRVRGTIGNGGRELRLATVNGSIRLRAAS